MSGNVRKSKSVRPLGAVRQPMQTPFDRVGRIPAFNYNKNHQHDIELQGNAMQVTIVICSYKLSKTLILRPFLGLRMFGLFVDMVILLR